jgi:hypothetical protein
MNPERPESSNRFRIKNVSNANMPHNPSFIASKTNVNKPTRVEPMRRQPSVRVVERKEEKIEEKKEIKET